MTGESESHTSSPLADQLRDFVDVLETHQTKALEDLESRWPGPVDPVDEQWQFAAEALVHQAVREAITHLRGVADNLSS